MQVGSVPHCPRQAAVASVATHAEPGHLTRIK